VKKLLIVTLALVGFLILASPTSAYYQQVASDSAILSSDGDTHEVTLPEKANWLILSLDSKAIYLTLSDTDATASDLNLTASEVPLHLKGLEDFTTFNVKADGNNVELSYMALRQN
jgi:hypothetical protein